MKIVHCRFCDSPLRQSFCDLGMSPLSNAYLKPEQLQQMEAFYPLHTHVCSQCYLVQLQEFESPEQIFSDYAYFSSYSESWLQHARKYTEYMAKRFGFNEAHQVIEIASNDGYLLQYFKAQGIPVLGIEPAANVAQVAEAAGIPTLSKFFGTATAMELIASDQQADLLLGNNVLAHVPDINDFVAGMKILLKTAGIITMEFPHLLRLMEQNQYDTIYHEHFSYLSLLTVEKIFARHGLTLFDVEELPTHGGSLRIFARHNENAALPVSENIANLKHQEQLFGLDELQSYRRFAEQVRESKRNILEFFIEAKQQGKSIAAYGAPAKGNTLLNYCGIRTDFIDYTVDRSPHKQGHYLPGTHIPVYAPERIAATKPDYLVILPWNLKTEIMEQMADIREWGGRFVVLIPEVQIL